LPISRIVILSEVRTRSVQTQSKGSTVRGLGTAAGEQQVPALRFNTPANHLKNCHPERSADAQRPNAVERICGPWTRYRCPRPPVPLLRL